MKRSVILLFAVLFLTSVVALGAAPKKYGKEITLKETTLVSEILAHPEKYDGKRVLVEGAIVDVCKGRGCWIKIGGDKETQSIQIKVDDGVIVFPSSAKGKTALAEGVVSVKNLDTQEKTKQCEGHSKEEGKMCDHATVIGAKTGIQIMGEGAVIK